MPLKKKPIYLEFDLFDQDTLLAAVEGFNLGAVEKADSLIFEGNRIVLLNEKTHTSRKLVVTTAKGTYFLKQIPWYCDDLAQIGFSHRLVNHLASCGLPVPRFMPEPGGRTWIEIQGAKFTLAEYLSGSTYEYLGVQDEAAANTLAQMHLAGSTLATNPQDPVESLLQIVHAHIQLARQQPFCTSHFSRQLDEIERVAQKRCSPPTLPQYPVHGDFIPWNLAFSNDRIAAAYDFDNCCMDSRLHDIGEALVAFFALDYAGQSSQLKPGIRQTPSVEQAQAFLTTYQSTFPLTNPELSWLPAYILGAWWECLLLSFIRNEQDENTLSEICDLPDRVQHWCDKVVAGIQ